MLIINTDTTEPHFEQRTILDGREYLLSLEWNQRAAFWFLSLSDENGSHIVSGIKVVGDWPLLRLVTDPRRPPGEIMAIDYAGKHLSPGRNNLLLTYIEASDL